MFNQELSHDIGNNGMQGQPHYPPEPLRRDTHTNPDFIQTINFVKAVGSAYPTILSLNGEESLVHHKIQECMSQGTHFLDASFGPTTPFIFGGELSQLAPQIEWARSLDLLGREEYCIFNQISPNEIRQGLIPNSYLLCAFSILAEQPGLVRRLFSVPDPNEQGVYGIWLCTNGIWKETLVDDYIPVVNVGAGVEFAFSRSSQDELWVSLLEKAYAKVHGGYTNIIEGDCITALRVLTGSPFKEVSNLQNSDLVWKSIMEGEQRGSVMCCRARNSTPYGNVQAGQCYAILGQGIVTNQQGQRERLVKVRLPWGGGKLEGKWSDSDPNWTAQNIDAMDYVFSKDGAQCLSLQDFAQLFDALYIFKTEPVFRNTAITIEGGEEGKGVLIDVVAEGEYWIGLEGKGLEKGVRACLAKVEGRSMTLVDGKAWIGEVGFIGGRLSDGRHILILDIMSSQSITITSFGPAPLSIVDAPLTKQQFQQAQQKLFRQLADRSKVLFNKIQAIPFQEGGKTANISKWLAKDSKLGLIFYHFRIDHGNTGVKMTFEIQNAQGLEVLGGENKGNIVSITIPLSGSELLVFKADPRYPQFGVVLKSIAASAVSDVVSNSFQDNRSPSPDSFRSPPNYNQLNGSYQVLERNPPNKAELPYLPQNRSDANTAQPITRTDRPNIRGRGRVDTEPQTKDGACNDCSLI